MVVSKKQIISYHVKFSRSTLKISFIASCRQVMVMMIVVTLPNDCEYKKREKTTVCKNKNRLTSIVANCDQKLDNAFILKSLLTILEI